jgi:23S rRNA (cytidine2498-2'-O)-methyltransferase
MAPDAAALLALAAQVPPAAETGSGPRFHVWDSDMGRPGARPDRAEQAAAATIAAWRDGLVAQGVAPEAIVCAGQTDAVAAPRAGASIIDIVLPPPKRGDAGAVENAFVGWHRHDAAVSPWPGGVMPLVTPPEAPSQAWRKIEEAFALTGLVPRRGEQALEIGAAPGGAVHALLKRGVATIAIDPQSMDPRIERLAIAEDVPYRNLVMPMADVQLETLPGHVDWLLVDAHLAGPVVLKGLGRFLRWYRHSLRGLFWTVKLHRWTDAERLPELMERLRSFDFDTVAARQLPSNGQEVLVWASRRPQRSKGHEHR